MAPEQENEILKILGRLDKRVAVLNTKLFGTEDGDGDNGRIPDLEDSSDDHEKRLKRLEGLALKLAAIGAAVSSLVGLGVMAVEIYSRFQK